MSRIAVIAHHAAPIVPPFAGGVESFTWYLVRWLTERGHEIVLYALPGSEVPGAEVRTLDIDPALSTAARTDVSMPAASFVGAHHADQLLMCELARSDEFDLVHANCLH